MWLGVLGPLSVEHDGTVIPVPAGKLRVLLGAMVVHANEVLSFDALSEALWDGAPPPGARATIRNYVKRLRQVLGPGVGARIVTRDPGYLIELAADEVDLLRFTLLRKEGDAALQAGAWPRASAVLGEALELWRGTPLVDVPSPVLQRDEVPRLEQLRLQAVEWRIDADLHLGRHAQVVPELRALAGAHPLRESVHEHLLLALAGCGRRAEALDAYQQARRVLVDELGIEPGPNLRQIHQRILVGDPALAAGPATGPAVAGHQPSPEPPAPPGAPGPPVLAEPPEPGAPPPRGPDRAGAVRRRRPGGRSRAGIGTAAIALVSAAALAIVLAFAVTHTPTAGGPAAGPSASPSTPYGRCPVGTFCLFNGKNGSTSYCTWITSDPIADRNCAWLQRGWKVRSVFNRTAATVEYCAQEQFQDCVGSTPPGGWGNLPATYTVRSVRPQ